MSKQRIEIGGEYVTRRHGYPARVVCDDLKSESYPLVVLVEEVPGKERLSGYAQDGHFRGDGVEHDLDLVPKPKRETVVVPAPPARIANHFPSIEQAKIFLAGVNHCCTHLAVFTLVNDTPVSVTLEPLPSPVERREGA